MPLFRSPERPTASFTYRGRRIAYHEHGGGSRPIVLIHGLLMDSRMYTKLAPKLAAHGHRVITCRTPGKCPGRHRSSTWSTIGAFEGPTKPGGDPVL